MVSPMFLIAPTAEVVTCCMLAIWARISSVGFRGLVGEALDLGGDHRKTPAGFAGARGLDVALSASRLVCDAIT